MDAATVPSLSELVGIFPYTHTAQKASLCGETFFSLYSQLALARIVFLFMPQELMLQGNKSDQSV